MHKYTPFLELVTNEFTPFANGRFCERLKRFHRAYGFDFLVKISSSSRVLFSSKVDEPVPETCRGYELVYRFHKHVIELACTEKPADVRYVVSYRLSDGVPS